MTDTAGTDADAACFRRVLKAGQRRAYREDGFVVLPGAMDPALLERVTQATMELWRKSRAIAKSDGYYDLAPDHAPDNPRVRRISKPTELDDVYVEAIFASVLGDIAAELIEGPVKFYHAKINFKLPRSPSTEIQWHQDGTHFPHTNSNLLAISLPMHARNAANGCMRFVPGSHRGGPLSIWRDGEYVFTCEGGMTEADFERVVDAPCAPGDVIAHHGLAVHGSTANPTDELCITLTIQYAAADAFAYTAPVIDSIHRGRMVRGQPARFARLEAGTIELPPDFSAGYKSLYASQDEAQESET